jgi:hypothetical protein
MLDTETRFLSDDQLEGFVQKLAAWRRTLSQPEQRVLDVILTAGETGDGEVQGYLFVEDALIRQAAVGAVQRLSRAVGRLHPAPDGLFQRLARADTLAHDGPHCGGGTPVPTAPLAPRRSDARRPV